MRILSAVASVIFLSLGNIAHAGDPCPITVKISDLGSPDWLDNLALINALESRQTWVGISYSSSDRGLLLNRIHEGSPAEQAGLLEGDLVVAIGARTISDDLMFGGLDIGQRVNVSVLRAGELQDIPLTIGGADPVPLAILHQLEDEDCRDSEFATPNEALEQAVMEAVFNQNRGFRCEDAHIALQPLMEPYESDTVYYVRGSRRLLLTMPYYGTTCVSVGSLDGDHLNDTENGAVIERVIRNYVRERFENP